MLDRIGRSLKDFILIPMERAIPRSVSPDLITWASLVPGLAAAMCAGFGLWGWALAAFAINRILDGLDGLVARNRDRQSDYGGYLDIMVDFAVYACIPVGVWLGATGTPLVRSAGASGVAESAGAVDVLPLIVLLAVFYINAASWMYLSAVIEKRRGLDVDDSRHTDTESGNATILTTVTMPIGVVEGTETVLFFSLFLLLPGHYMTLFWIMSAATAAGVVQRLIWAYRNLR